MVSFANEFEKSKDTEKGNKSRTEFQLQNDYPTTVHPHATKKGATEKKALRVILDSDVQPKSHRSVALSKMISSF